MDNISEIIKMLSSNKPETKTSIPKEISDQYPYGEFPIRYTKSGQEKIRKHSESRFSYSEPPKLENNDNNSFDIQSLLPLIHIFSGGKKSPQDLMHLFGKMLFKDNPLYEKLFCEFGKIKSKEINTDEHFPETEIVSISSLKRIK
ncbi:MAG: hypothetical protein E7345_01045 [Clostridiales bacterium]|nr:hypothetical protein [Clostridiales bacterium]